MDIKLTKDSEKMLREIYVEYLKRINEGIPKHIAKDFTNKNEWPDPRWSTAEGLNCLTELGKSGFIRRYVRGSFRLEDKAIIHMENRFKNGLSEILDWIAKIKSAIPFV